MIPLMLDLDFSSLTAVIQQNLSKNHFESFVQGFIWKRIVILALQSDGDNEPRKEIY